MEIITIQVSDTKAMKLIQDLVDLKIIRIVKDATTAKQQKEQHSIPSWQKKILDERIKNLAEDKKKSIDFDDAIRDISAELGL